jgi:hypothetical protein
MGNSKQKPEQQKAFEGMLRSVLQTSHAELKAKLEQEKKQRAVRKIVKNPPK